jgi:hypothetical protein
VANSIKDTNYPMWTQKMVVVVVVVAVVVCMVLHNFIRDQLIMILILSLQCQNGITDMQLYRTVPLWKPMQPLWILFMMMSWPPLFDKSVGNSLPIFFGIIKNRGLQMHKLYIKEI